MRVAAIDIGTNTARLLVAVLRQGELIDELRVTEVCGLGRGVDGSGRLGADAIARTVAVLEKFAQPIRGADRVRVVATSASRDAANRGEFFDAAEDVLGHRPELITGETEAELSFSGAALGRPGPVLVIDVGGGSTEFVFGTSRPDYAESVDIGSVRLTDRLLVNAPPSGPAVAAARQVVSESVAKVTPPVRASEVVGVAGTFTSLAAMALGLVEYDRTCVHNSVLSLGDVTTLVQELAILTVEQIEQIPSLDAARAPVILGGAIVVEQVMDTLAIPRVTVSEHDLLDGVARSLLPE